jgi:ethanolamine ammonia-lyase large subunit
MLLLAAAGCNYFMGVPCSDDVMLNYQSTSYHDALAVRKLFNLRPAPEFLGWLQRTGIYGDLAPKAQTEEIRQLFKNGVNLALKDASHNAI